MRFNTFGLLFILSFVSQSSWAQWIQVTGKASLANGRYEVARQQAKEDALQKAVLQFGVHVKSHQRMENGILKEDKVSLSSEARVNKASVDDEFVSKGVLNLIMNVDVVEVPSCPTSQASSYKKKVAILGFSIQTPKQSSLGKIQNIERGLSGSLNQSLRHYDNLVVYESSQIALQHDTENAPSGFTAQKTLSNAAEFAKEMGAQFVVSGVVRDMSVEDESSFSNSYWTTLKRFSHSANLNRKFSLEVFVHDGFSGAIVWQKNFSITAPWHTDLQEKIGFGSAEFLSDDYGKAVSKLVGDVAGLISEQLRCQPFITRISRVVGKTLHFSSGASSGVRPGDKFALYRTSNFYDSNMLKGMELTNVKAALTVSQVHPGFASGKISIDPGRLNIQEDDVLIAW